MAVLLDFLKLIRPQQWYKNLLIFLPLIFGGKLFDIDLFYLTVVGFAALCLVSSSNYVINDVIDYKKDRLNKEKQSRPVASGKISRSLAVVLALIFLLFSVFISLRLNVNFLYSVLSLFFLTQLYSLFLKNEVFVDLLMIGVNFIIRAASGALLLSISISPWLVLCVFFLSLFLSASKRKSEIAFLGEGAQKHRAVLEKYSKDIVNMLLIIATCSLILSYSLYSFLSQYHNLFYTIPLALYVILRYVYLTEIGSDIARHPERTIKDYRIVLASMLWAVVTFYLLYFVK